MPRIPKHFQRIECDALRKQEAGDCSDAEERGGGAEDDLVSAEQRALRERDKSARGAVAQHGDADHHVGEVMPQDDREQAHQQDLVTERGCREQRDGSERRGRHPPRDCAADDGLGREPCVGGH